MQKIKLVSHYNKIGLKIRLDQAKADQLLSCDSPIDLINEDIDRVKCGYTPFYISPYQAKKIVGHLSGTDYFDKIERDV
jgi:hypothetical protein